MRRIRDERGGISTELSGTAWFVALVVGAVLASATGVGSSLAAVIACKVAASSCDGTGGRPAGGDAAEPEAGVGQDGLAPRAAGGPLAPAAQDGRQLTTVPAGAPADGRPPPDVAEGPGVSSAVPPPAQPATAEAASSALSVTAPPAAAGAPRQEVMALSALTAAGPYGASQQTGVATSALPVPDPSGAPPQTGAPWRAAEGDLGLGDGFTLPDQDLGLGDGFALPDQDLGLGGWEFASSDLGVSGGEDGITWGLAPELGALASLGTTRETSWPTSQDLAAAASATADPLAPGGPGILVASAGDTLPYLGTSSSAQDATLLAQACPPGVSQCTLNFPAETSDQQILDRVNGLAGGRAVELDPDCAPEFSLCFSVTGEQDAPQDPAPGFEWLDDPDATFEPSGMEYLPPFDPARATGVALATGLPGRIFLNAGRGLGIPAVAGRTLLGTFLSDGAIRTRAITTDRYGIPSAEKVDWAAPDGARWTAGPGAVDGAELARQSAITAVTSFPLGFALKGVPGGVANSVINLTANSINALDPGVEWSFEAPEGASTQPSLLASPVIRDQGGAFPTTDGEIRHRPDWGKIGGTAAVTLPTSFAGGLIMGGPKAGALALLTTGAQSLLDVSDAKVFEYRPLSPQEREAALQDARTTVARYEYEVQQLEGKPMAAGQLEQRRRELEDARRLVAQYESPGQGLRFTPYSLGEYNAAQRAYQASQPPAEPLVVDGETVLDAGTVDFVRDALAPTEVHQQLLRSSQGGAGTAEFTVVGDDGKGNLLFEQKFDGPADDTPLPLDEKGQPILGRRFMVVDGKFLPLDPVEPAPPPRTPAAKPPADAGPVDPGGWQGAAQAVWGLPGETARVFREDVPEAFGAAAQTFQQVGQEQWDTFNRTVVQPAQQVIGGTVGTVGTGVDLARRAVFGNGPAVPGNPIPGLSGRCLDPSCPNWGRHQGPRPVGEATVGEGSVGPEFKGPELVGPGGNLTAEEQANLDFQNQVIDGAAATVEQFRRNVWTNPVETLLPLVAPAPTQDATTQQPQSSVPGEQPAAAAELSATAEVPATLGASDPGTTTGLGAELPAEGAAEDAGPEPEVFESVAEIDGQRVVVTGTVIDEGEPAAPGDPPVALPQAAAPLPAFDLDGADLDFGLADSTLGATQFTLDNTLDLGGDTEFGLTDLDGFGP